jgi:hypothetical protein
MQYRLKYSPIAALTATELMKLLALPQLGKLAFGNSFSECMPCPDGLVTKKQQILSQNCINLSILPGKYAPSTLALIQ